MHLPGPISPSSLFAGGVKLEFCYCFICTIDLSTFFLLLYTNETVKDLTKNRIDNMIQGMRKRSTKLENRRDAYGVHHGVGDVERDETPGKHTLQTRAEWRQSNSAPILARELGG